MLYQLLLFRYMESKEPTVFTSSYKEGMKRVLQGNFAFLCESSMLDYVVQRDCNLTQIGGLVDSKGYGIATPKGSRWKDRISQAILFLQEKSSIQVRLAYHVLYFAKIVIFLKMLYNKWWKGGAKVCPKTDYDPSKASALNVVNIGGIFVVLLCGLSFAILVAIAEFCMKVNCENELHPATVNVVRGGAIPVTGSLWVQIYRTVMLLFYGKRGGSVRGRQPTDCSSCQSLAQDGQGVRYM